jgi:lipopolysaccharide export system permease protein
MVRASGAARGRSAGAEAHAVRLFVPLDRYVFREFWKIFAATAVGFPLLVIIIDLTEKLDTYLNRNLSRGQILMSYLYWIPESMFLALPAAVLFATVFSIGALTRHSEITAAKASGISFHRLTLPIFLGAAVVAVLAGVLGEIVPVANEKRNTILEEKKFSGSNDRFNFTYAGEEGRVYKIQALNVGNGAIDFLEVERKGNGPAYPTTIVTSRAARWSDTARHWLLRDGQMHIVPTDSTSMAIQFDSLADHHFVEAPRELMAAPKTSQEMRYQELSRFITALERSGSSEVNRFKVEKALRIAIPVTCLIIAIFGAPLATTTQRGGAAYGIGVSLGVTVIFLMLIQLTKAIGGGGLLPPNVAAWMPNAVFGLTGAFLLARTRT